MNIYIDPTVEFGNIDIQKFVYDRKQRVKVIEAADHTGYELAESREVANASHKESVLFQVEETWALDKDSAPSAYNKLIVIYSQEIEIKVLHELFLKKGISETIALKAKDFFLKYNPKQDGKDIEGWVAQQLGDGLEPDMFVVDVETKLEKLGDWTPENCEQLKYFWSLHNHNFTYPNEPYFNDQDDEDPIPHCSPNWGGQVESQVDILGDNAQDIPAPTLSDWSSSNDYSIRFISRKLMLQWENENDLIHELPAADLNDPVKVQSFIDDIAEELVPSDCGVMIHRQHKLLTLFSWPEFKIEWKRKRVKIGCATVTIIYPRLLTRTAKLVCYVYYSVPDDVISSALKIAETCAIRSALSAGVVGVVTSNPAVAQAAFNELFRRCVMKEIIKCVNPGLLVLKESSSWS